MRITAILIVCVAMTAAFMLTCPATASTIAVKLVEQGATPSGTTFQILLDEAPAGLAGYRMEIAAGGSPGGQIVQVQFPDWTTLYQAGVLPADNTTLKAVDLREAIGRGARNILLATVNLTPGSSATPALVIRSVEIEDDSGNVSTPLFPASLAPSTATPSSTAAPSGTTSSTVPEMPSPTAGTTTRNTTPVALTPSPTPGNKTPAVTTLPVTGVTTGYPVSTTSELMIPSTPAGTESATPGNAPVGTPPTRVPVPAILVILAVGLAHFMRRT